MYAELQSKQLLFLGVKLFLTNNTGVKQLLKFHDFISVRTLLLNNNASRFSRRYSSGVHGFLHLIAKGNQKCSGPINRQYRGYALNS